MPSPPNTKTAVAKHRVSMGWRTNPVLQCRVAPNRRHAKLLAVVVPQADHQGHSSSTGCSKPGCASGSPRHLHVPPHLFRALRLGGGASLRRRAKTRLQLSPSRLTTLLSRRGPSRARRPSWDQAGKGEKRMSRCNRDSRSNGMDHPSVRITISNGPDHPQRPPHRNRYKEPPSAAEFTTHLIPQPLTLATTCPPRQHEVPDPPLRHGGHRPLSVPHPLPPAPHPLTPHRHLPQHSLQLRQIRRLVHRPHDGKPLLPRPHPRRHLAAHDVLRAEPGNRRARHALRGRRLRRQLHRRLRHRPPRPAALLPRQGPGRADGGHL